MARKIIQPTDTAPEDASLLEQQVRDKLAESLGQLTRAQAITVIKAQREHDAALAAEEERQAKEAEKASTKKDKTAKTTR